jgi:hypothetical protein
MLAGTTLEERRSQLEALRLHGPTWMTPDTLDDGAALYAAVCDRGLEGSSPNS